MVEKLGGRRFPVTGLRSVDLVVPDLDRAIAFHTGVWGLHTVDEIAGSAWLRSTGGDPRPPRLPCR